MLAELGKTLVFLGVVIAALGGLLWLSGGTIKNLPFGRLPRDIVIQKDNKTIITLAHILGMDAIAEGVETIEQVKQLQALNCEFAQGICLLNL